MPQVVLVGIALAATGAYGADPVPRFDVQASCRAAADQGQASNAVSACQRDEQDARTKLDQTWPQFTAADRAQCVQMSTLGGAPTYTELLTCLEMARDVRELRKTGTPVTNGRAPR